VDLAKGITLGRVKTGRDNNKLRVKLGAQGREDLLKGGDVTLVAHIIRVPPDVHILAQSLPRTNLGGSTLRASRVKIALSFHTTRKRFTPRGARMEKEPPSMERGTLTLSQR